MAAANYYDQVQKIYVAYLGRPADPGGLEFWAKRLDGAKGDLREIIEAYGNSPESTALYSGSSNSEIVTAIYQQMFKRAPDAEGLKFYTDALAAKKMTAATIALNVADGATGTDATILANKVSVAKTFTDAVNLDPASLVAYSGATAASTARTLISGVTTSVDTASVTAAIAAIKSESVAGQTFTLTAAMTLALADALPDLYNIASGDVDGGNSSVEAFNEGFALAEIVIAGATNASTVDLNVTYTITDTLANLAAADSEILEGAESYSLSGTAFTADPVNSSVAGLAAAIAATQAAFFSDDEQAIIDDAANGDEVEVSVAYSLTDTVANLAAASAAVLAGAASYSLSNAAGALGDLTQAQIDVVEGASNAASFTYGLQGSTFVLTADDDTPVLTVGNDTITGKSSTLSVDDRLGDPSTTDNDTLNLTLTSDPPALDASNIENINMVWDAFSTIDVDLDNVSGSTVTVSSTKVGYGGSANFTNVGDNNIVAGAGVTATVAVDGIEDADLTATVARTVSVGATTAADGAVKVTAPVATTVTVVGGDDVTISATNATAVTVTSAGADTVDLTLGKTATVTSTGTTSDMVLRSASAITVTLADTTDFDTLKADSTISLRLADSSDFTAKEISGAASIRIDDDAGGAFDAELFDVPLVRYTLAQTTGTHTYANGAKLQADVDFGQAITFATSTSEDSSSDVIDLTVKASQTAELVFDTASRDFETVNLTVDAVGAATLAAVDAGTGTVNLATNQNTTITLLDAGELNAFGITKDLTVTQNTAADLTVVAGSGTNSATFTGTTHDSSYSGGTGNDTVTFVNDTGDASALVSDGVNSVTADAITTGTLAVVGGSGNDTVSATALTTGQAVLNLGAGVNTVTAGAAASGGTYDITGGSGNDAITLTGTTLTITTSVGDGVNSLTADTLTTGSATYTGGAGNDTISATAHASGTLTVTAGDGTNSLTAGTTTGTVVFVGGSGNDTVALASGTTGSFNINVADGSANSVTLTATTGSVTITGGAGVDTVSLTTLETGTAVIDTGAEADAITVTGTFGAGGSVSVTAGAGNDTITYTSATATGFTTNINGGDGTDTVELGVQAGGTVVDYTDGTITLTGIEVIDIGSSTTDTRVDGDLLNGKSYTIIGDGTATDQLTVHLDTAGTYDFSSIGISATVGTALGGLAVAAQAAATTNSITATAGNDSIDGGTGVDTMIGGAGADTLVGGTGNDVFVLGTTAQTRVTGYATATGAVTALSVDYFEDFEDSGTDKIQLSSAAGAYGTGLTLSTSATINVTQVAINDTVTNDTDNLTELVALVEAASAGVASSASTLRVYVVSFTNDAGDLDAGKFIIINDGTAGLAITDTIIAVGTTTAADIVSSSFTIV